MQTHRVAISHFRSASSHPGSSHPYENCAFFCHDSALIVSGVVSYLERCEGDFCLMCVCVCVCVCACVCVCVCVTINYCSVCNSCVVVWVGKECWVKGLPVLKAVFSYC
jgi:hypothetical protein